MVIYKILNTVNGKCYIGQTIHSKAARWAGHKRSLNRNKHYNDYLQHAWNKYGEDKFECSVIAVAETAEQLNTLEIFHVACSGDYNLKTGGGSHGSPNEATRRKIGNAIRGKKNPCTEETKKKLRAAMTGKKATKQTKKKLSAALRQRWADTDQRAMMTEASTGRTHSEETKHKMSLMATGRLHTDETKKKLSKNAKGRIISASTRKKISESNQGHPAWNKGVPQSEETKRKISKAGTGRKYSKEAKKRMSEAQKKAWSDPEIRRKRIGGLMGRVVSEATRKKISLAHKRRNKK